MCGLEIRYEDQTVISIRGDQNDPFSRGHICPKAVAMKDIYEDPDRLKYPVKKTSDGWKQISWEEAYDEVVSKLKGIQEKYGTDAVGSYVGNPNAHNFGSGLFLPPFLKSLKTKNKFSATSADQLPHHFASRLMFGHYFVIPIPDIDHTQYMLIMGANPMVSNGSLMTAPDFSKRLKAIRQRGGKVVVIDPRKTETAKKSDEHHFIRPGSDALFLLGILNEIFEKGLENPGHLLPHLKGWEQIKDIVKDFTPEKVAMATGIPADQIKKIAHEFCAAKSAVAYGRLGLSTQEFGGICQWLINVINIATGNLDRQGGALFPLPAFDHVGMRGAQGRTGSYDRFKSRVSNLAEFGGELPVSVLAEEILTEGEGQIKAMVTVAGNPVLSTPNGTQVDKAFSQLEFMVAIDIYINETTRHADIILPTATGLEISHFDLAFHVLAIRNTVKFSPPLFDIDENQKYDWQILGELTDRLTGKPGHGLRPEQIVEMGLLSGPYKDQKLSIEKLLQHPHGIDLGPLQPTIPDRIFTEDKKIEVVPQKMLEDMDRLKKYLQSSSTPSKFPFLLIGRRLLRSNNSWMHNSYRLVKGPALCTLLLHPEDARSLGIQKGQVVEVKSRTGSVKIAAEISEEMMKGVVSIPHGFGHLYEDIQLETASKHPGVSINDLTDEKLIDDLTGNAAFSGVPVQVSI